MNNKLVSIIVPVYNAELYLDRCVNSLVEQTYKNIEIILVNDGSTDSTLDLCNKYKSKDKRVILINKKNEGVSCARNDGIEISNGEYITFVDSDDYLEKNFVEYHVNKIIQYGADCTISNGIDFNDAGKYIRNKKIYKEIELNGLEILNTHLSEEYFSSVCWGNLYKKDVVKTIKFDKNMKIAEDMKFLTEYFEKIKKAVMLPESKYYYYLREGSAIRSGFNEAWLGEINFCNKLIEKYKGTILEENAINRFIRINLTCMCDFKLDKKYVKILKTNLRKYKKDYLKGKMTFKRKVKFLMLIYFYWIVKIFK